MMIPGPEGFTDLHSHLVPGVDDGSRTLEEALESLGRLKDLGVRRLVTTPHLDGSLTRELRAFGPRMEELDQAWAALRSGAERDHPEVELQRGHEVMLDIPDPDLSDPRLHLAETPFVLAEWPSLQVPPGTLRVLEEIRETGVKLIIAHPERYRGLDGPLKLAGEWRGKGAFLQVNYGSLLGRYGETPRRRALTLLERGWVDLFSSDFHGRAHLSPSLQEARDFLFEQGGEEQFDLLARVNTTRVLEGEDPLPVPPMVIKKGIWEVLRAALRPKER